MKICLPTEGKNGLSEVVHNHFGSAKYFTIYDTSLKLIEIIKNDNEHHEHGSCNPVGSISKYNIDAIMTNGMGRRAVQKLNDDGIKVYLLDGNTVNEAIKNFETNKLTELTSENACGGHGCH
ncbi:MAG: hypothetical protein A2Y40_00670 [Candidatus Margulisbacteria bacterium GWF2_35_9]|nr:MAG: hypothetical protein A2Y40_00670 [Candidatus Margulisbacteria bacterium GWF2_35_9]